MSSDVIISAQNLSKSYKIFGKPQDRLKQMLWRGRRRYFEEFWAIRDLSFSIPRGLCVGIIGRNGSGKSTLLQLIAGTLTPTSGSIHVGGNVAALLELGTGFDPEFSGEENIFVNGALHGFTRQQMEQRYDAIVSFADIGQFLQQPVKTYSSGMLVRLAFAVAITVDPEILIIDEALAVGDVKFQAKCFRRFQELRERGTTILFVSHATEQVVRHCDYALLLENGRLLEDGDPKTVTHHYLNLLFGVAPTPRSTDSLDESEREEETKRLEFEEQEIAGFVNDGNTSDVVATRPGYNREEYRWGNGGAQIIDYLLAGERQFHANHFSGGEEITVFMKVLFRQRVERPIYGLTIKTPDGVTVYGTNSRDWEEGGQFIPQDEGSVVVVKLSFRAQLLSGHYLLSLGVAGQEVEEVVPLDRRYDVIEIWLENDSRAFGLADLALSYEFVSARRPPRSLDSSAEAPSSSDAPGSPTASS